MKLAELQALELERLVEEMKDAAKAALEGR